MRVEAAEAATAIPPEVLAATARSWYVLPVQARGKTPLIAAWPQKASRDAATVAGWVKQFAGCNWGVLTGRRSKLFVLDCDGEAGKRELLAFARIGLLLPATLTVCTGRGKHFYFRLPDGWRVPNSVGKVAPGLDIRGDGGFVVMPPSTHESGERYRYECDHVPVSEAPQWLISRVASPSLSTPTSIHEGFRNDDLTRIAGRHRRRGATQEQIAAILLRANESRCHRPLERDEVLRIAASVSRYPPKGADILDLAWQRVISENHKTNECKFRAIIFHLSEMRPGQPIALPLERIAEHIGCDWTLIRRHRNRAIKFGVIVPLEDAVPHKRAATFVVPSID
jgi:hypothetical protein